MKKKLLKKKIYYFFIDNYIILLFFNFLKFDLWRHVPRSDDVINLECLVAEGVSVARPSPVQPPRFFNVHTYGRIYRI